MKSKKVYFVRTGILLALLALAGCMSGVKQDEDASVIKDRAVQRWDFLIAHQADKAYDFLSPGYRATKTREAYATEMNDRGTHWNKVTYLSQTCKPDVCTVHLAVNYKLNLGGAVGDTKGNGFSTETWIKAAGRWYYLPNQFQPKPGKEGEAGKP